MISLNLSERDKTILIALGVILVIICYVEIFLMPMVDKISQVRQETEEVSTKLNKFTVTTAQYNSNKSKKDDLDKQVEEASKALPSIPKEPEITYDVKSQADNAKVQISAITFSGSSDFDPLTITMPGENSKIKNLKAPDGKLMNLSANIVCSGNYNALLNFINNIETDKRIAEVQNINVASAGDDKLQISLSINYYYLEKQGNSNEAYDFLKSSSSYGKSDMFTK